MTDAPAILAAGAVCWRVVGGKVRILLVQPNPAQGHLPPKGKVDPGELLPQTAVREIAEETGLVGRARRATRRGALHDSERTRQDRVLLVGRGGCATPSRRRDFRPNDEIAALEWVSII